MVRLAQTGIYDAVVLASRDTDLIPSLDEANRSDTHIEAVKWFKRDVSESGGPLRPDTFRLWTTSLDEDAFRLSTDDNMCNRPRYAP
ncbi:MAG: hypothetical protein LKI24_09795 [Acidipropionibacterium sp.]|jgi:uncharacterized LabA/DUF88 family protein|nr:hypothetical protein [Acidipropionibacterium sp.]